MKFPLKIANVNPTDNYGYRTKEYFSNKIDAKTYKMMQFFINSDLKKKIQNQRTVGGSETKRNLMFPEDNELD